MNRLVLFPGDALDAFCVPRLRRALTAVPQRADTRIIVDLSRVHYADSFGLAALTRMVAEARARGAIIALTAGSATLGRLLTLIGLGGLPWLQAPV